MAKDFIPYSIKTFSEEKMLEKSHDFAEWLSTRRTVRHFAKKPVPIEVIENIISAANTAPSGANLQPWTFCVVSDPTLKKEIREAAEKEEYENYKERMSDEWLEDIDHLGTDHHKPFLEEASHLIVLMKQSHGYNKDGSRKRHYYVNESVGIACGMLLSAIHNAGLVAVTHTPSPMGFLKKILNRPRNEQPFLLIPVGFPADNVEVPNITRKSLREVMSCY